MGILILFPLTFAKWRNVETVRAVPTSLRMRHMDPRGDIKTTGVLYPPTVFNFSN